MGVWGGPAVVTPRGKQTPPLPPVCLGLSGVVLATSSREKAEATGPPPQRYNLAKKPVPGLGFLVYKVRRRKLF